MFKQDIGRTMIFGVVVLGWVVLALFAWVLVERVGWFGVGLLGLVVLLIASRAQLSENMPDVFGSSVRSAGPRPVEHRRSDSARHTDFMRWISATKAFGLALVILGFVMFARYQL